MKCNNCGTENTDTSVFCGECGSELVKEKVCPNCNHSNNISSFFCTNCGTSLNSEDREREYRTNESEEYISYSDSSGNALKSVRTVFIVIICIFVFFNIIGLVSMSEKNADYNIEDGTLLAYKGNSEEIVIPHSVRQIGVKVFENNSSIRKVVIPGSCKHIGNYAFAGCYNLSEIEIREGVESIGEGAFAAYRENPNISLSYLEIPGSVKTIGGYAFQNYVNLRDLIFNEGLEKIDNNAFLCTYNTQNTELLELTFPESIREIGAYAFQCHVNLGEVYYPRHAVLGAGVFNFSKLDYYDGVWY